MNEINKLVDLVTHNLKSSFGVIDLSGQVENPGKEQQLYNGVLSGEFTSDEVTAQGMYKADIYDQRFRMLKSRLRYKLFDLIYHFDFEQPQFSLEVRKKLECKEYNHKAILLYEIGEFSMAEKQFNKVLVLAAENQFTEELIVANELKRKILAKEFKPTDFELTLETLSKLRVLRDAEEKSDDLFLKMEMLLFKSIHSRNTNGDTNIEAIKEMEALFASTKSYNIFNNLYRLKIWSYLLINDFKGLIDYLNSVPAIIDKLEVTEGRFDMNHLNYLLATCHLHLDEFSKGLDVVNKYLQSIDPATDQWFNYREPYFLLALHNENYTLALEILQEVIKNPKYSKCSEQIVNRWKVFKLYLHFAAPDMDIFKRVRFQDMYEAGESYFNELSGYKMTMFLLEFIHIFKKGDVDGASVKLDDLESYFYKYLNDPGKNSREKQFFKMIKVLRSSNFDVEDTEVKVQKYFEKMNTKNSQTAFSDIEIIPLEQLWKLLLNAVKENVTVAS